MQGYANHLIQEIGDEEAEHNTQPLKPRKTQDLPLPLPGRYAWVFILETKCYRTSCIQQIDATYQPHERHHQSELTDYHT
jgi:hypothetical protein